MGSSHTWLFGHVSADLLCYTSMFFKYASIAETVFLCVHAYAEYQGLSVNVIETS